MTSTADITTAFGKAAEALAEAGMKGTERFAVADFSPSCTGLSIVESCGVGDELLRFPVHLCLTDRVADAPAAMRPALEFAAAADDSSAEARHRRLCVRLWLEYLQPSSPALAAWLPALVVAARARSEASALRWSEETNARCGALSCVPRYVDVANTEIDSLRKTLAALSSNLPELCPKVPDASDAEWIHLTCQARSATVCDRLATGGAAKRAANEFRCLVPLLDVAHTAAKTGSGGTLAELVTGTVIVSALSAMQAGEQVLCGRGNCSNDELAVTSGAVVTENAHQQVVLSLAFGVLRKEQLTVLQGLGLDRFLRADDKERAIVTIVLRKADPFPNVAVVLGRVLTGSEASPNLQMPVSNETTLIDRLWLPTLLQALKGQLQQYPMREAGKTSEDAADVIYDSSRDVLKAAVGQLLEMTRQITPPAGSE